MGETIEPSNEVKFEDLDGLAERFPLRKRKDIMTKSCEVALCNRCVGELYKVLNDRLYRQNCICECHKFHEEEY